MHFFYTGSNRKVLPEGMQTGDFSSDFGIASMGGHILDLWEHVI
jgi:hypothetical protein